jgi:hypothetical protein
VLVSGCANLGGTLTLDLPDCMFLNFHRKLFGGLWYRLTNPDDPSSLEEFILMNYSCYSGNFTEITLNNTNEDECTKITPVADYGEKGKSRVPRIIKEKTLDKAEVPFSSFSYFFPRNFHHFFNHQHLCTALFIPPLGNRCFNYFISFSDFFNFWNCCTKK